MNKDEKKSVPEGYFDPEAELQKYLREMSDEERAQAEKNSAEEEALYREQDNAETIAGRAAAAPDYDADMKIDARGIAEKLMGDIPKPTLGSIRLQLAQCEGGFERMLTDIADVRVKTRETGAARVLIQLLHTGNYAGLRKYAAESFYPAVAGLTDEELREYTALHCQSNGHILAGIGVYIGALLSRNGLTLDEVIEVASDPVFQSYVVALRATKHTANEHALEVISSTHRERARRTLKGVS